MTTFRFATIDFETAGSDPRSACAVAVVLAEDFSISRRFVTLLKPPPETRFKYTRLHGISRKDVADAPRFADVWSEIESIIAGLPFLAAHNAVFDRRVLKACLGHAGISVRTPRMLCTMRLARRVWTLPGYSLPAVCDFLGIELSHHDPLSDAEACARIVFEARRELGDHGFESLVTRKETSRLARPLS